MNTSVNQTQRRGNGARITGWVLLLAGLAMLSLAVFRDARLAVFGERTAGVVESVKEIATRNTRQRREGESKKEYAKREGGIKYLLTVRYTPIERDPVTFETTATWGHDLNVGDEVKVAYNASRAEIDSVKQIWLPVITGIVFSSLITGVGWLLARRRPL